MLLSRFSLPSHRSSMATSPWSTVSLASLASLLVALLFLAPNARAQDDGALLEVAPRGEKVEIGKDFVVELKLNPPRGASIVVGSVAATATADDGVAFFGLAYPLKALTAAAPGGAVFGGQAAFEFVAPVNYDAAPGVYAVTMTVTYQLGGPDSPQRTASWQGEIEVDFGKEWNAAKITYYLESRGMFLFLIVVFGFGLLMSFSPCIYPMIPITLAVIGAQSQEKGALHGLKLSLAYAVGLALVYAIIGALAATVFAGITAFMQSPWVLVPIAVLMLGLSFGMFGAYELQAPAFLRDRLQGPGGGRSGLIGVFLMGMVAGLVASPCVGPFLAALIVWIATTGSLALGFWSLFLFGMGMSVLLVAVGTFPGMVSTLPAAGGWMESIKKAMGLLLVAMAFFFVRPGLVLPEQIFYPLLGITTILTAVYLGAFDPVTMGCHWSDRARKGLGLIVLVVGIYVLGGSLLRYNLILPAAKEHHAGGALVAMDATLPAVSSNPGAATAVTAAPKPTKVPFTVIHTGENVRAFIDENIALAKSSGRPIVIDFWATWCKLCLLLDKKVWVDPEVIAESERFIPIKVDATKSDEEMEAIWRDYNIGGLPAIIFIDSRGEVLHGKTVAGFMAAPQMLERMQSIR